MAWLTLIKWQNIMKNKKDQKMIDKEKIGKKLKRIFRIKEQNFLLRKKNMKDPLLKKQKKNWLQNGKK